MKSYPVRLLELFTACIHDEKKIEKLTEKEKAKYTVYRHRLKYGKPISERNMRETIEKQMGAKIQIILP